MNLKSSRGTFEGVVFFLLSPVLSLPVIVVNLVRGNKFMNKLIICLCSLVSFLYIPAFSNDKMRYLERYSYFKSLNFTEYLNYLVITKRPDFILETLVYLFSTLSIRVEFLFFIVTFISLSFMNEVIEKVAKISNVLFVTILFLLSISFPNLFSGIRFYFALSFLVYAYYLLFDNNNKKKFFIYSCVALLTHFSMVILIFIALFVYYFKSQKLKYLFIFSFVFFFVPKSVLFNFVGFFEVSESYNNKASSYLNEEDRFGESLQNASSFIAYHGKLLWYYCVCVFMMFRKTGKDDIWWRCLFVMAAFINITFSVPVVFFRYSLAFKLIFLIVLLKDDYYYYKHKSYVYLYVLLCVIGALIEVNQIRYNLMSSLFKKENIIIYGILQQKTDERSFIDF